MLVDGHAADLAHDPVVGQLFGPEGIDLILRRVLGEGAFGGSEDACEKSGDEDGDEPRWISLNTHGTLPGAKLGTGENARSIGLRVADCQRSRKALAGSNEYKHFGTGERGAGAMGR